MRVHDPDKGERWLIAACDVVGDGDGAPARVAGMTIDITDRKRAERALAEQRERFRVTLSSIGDAVIATDARGRVTFTNPVAEDLTGWDQEEAAGKPLEDVFRIVYEETREPVEHPVARVLRDGTSSAWPTIPS